MNVLAASTPPDLLPSWISALATAAGVLVAAVAIGLTLLQVSQTAKQLRDNADREARDSEERTRPYVWVDVAPSLAGSPAVDVVVRNTGHTTARNVRLSVTDAPFTARFEGDAITPTMGRAFSEGFDLAPAAHRRYYWHFPANENAAPSGQMGAPASGEIVLQYQWRPDASEAVRDYEERYRYNLDDLLRLAPVPFSGSDAGAGGDPVERNMVHALRAIARNLGEGNR